MKWVCFRREKTGFFIARLVFVQQSHWIQNSENVNGFKHRLKLFVALMCSSAWTRGELQQQQYSKWHIPRRKLFKHLSVAQHLFLLWFCCFDFVYSSLSRSAGFILRCLHLFPITLIPQHKRINLFISGMSQLPRQRYWARCMFFFLKHSEERPVDWTEGYTKNVLILTCLFSTAKTCWVSNKTGTIILCRPCVCWSTSQ